MAVGTAVKADGSNGVLKPTSFTVGGISTEITGLEWANNKVVLTLGTHVSLSGYVLEFIELDGSVLVVPERCGCDGGQHGGDVVADDKSAVGGRR